MSILYFNRLILLLLTTGLAGCAPQQKPSAALSPIHVPHPIPAPRPYLLHIPGVSGESIVDHTLLQGFRDGHLDADLEIYDWTEHDPGVPALQAIGRNKKQAMKIANRLTAKFRADPRLVIYLTCHSGGAGLAAWALEDLPPDVKVQRVLFIAPALSPGYDLSRALSHVRDKAYAFYSDRDTVVLSVGTRVFGTIDGVYADAAGNKGFTQPAGADPKQYAKLVQFPYDIAWARLGHYGDHIGPMSTPFAREILEPLLEAKP